MAVNAVEAERALKSVDEIEGIDMIESLEITQYKDTSPHASRLALDWNLHMHTWSMIGSALRLLISSATGSIIKPIMNSIPRIAIYSSLGILLSFMFAAQGFSKTKIVFLGDSITEGYGVDHDKAFPALIEKELKTTSTKEIVVVNAGISGSTTASALKRLQWQLKGHPDILFICLGANDGLRGLKLEDSKKNLAATIDLAKKSGLKIILAGMKIPPNYGESYTKQFEKIFPDLAKEYNIALIPFLLKDVAAIPALNLPDGIHPNEKGHEIVAKTLLPFILEALK